MGFALQKEGKRVCGDLEDEDILHDMKRQRSANDNQFLDEQTMTEE